MTRHPEETETVLASFAIEPTHDRETLDRYLSAHPDLRSELLALALELEFDEIDESPLDLESSVVAESWTRYSAASSEPLTSASFTREVAKSLGVKTAVVVQLRDRAISFASIPQRFLARLSRALGAGLEELSAYLNAPRNLAPGASYKSDGKPAAAQQMTLAEVMSQCGHTSEEIAKLLDEE
ncbi:MULTISPECIES: hypothetical protein [unclassified Mesorhizobium]|uniref:hypothetical protein n=1 Tax=unclassified Mesorhizobium TaxID=325217 RepID=UPI000FCB1390|nr:MULTISPECIES: hypothetical protein [unclassified Mesorhizobium]RUV54416.1 hypothetical protein EOA85_25000 [Mesorhizobium sp. M5C.F.Ca.IN.020.29.1.1]RWK51052.1 MAG: hypothetical protein EOR48_26125 [Mesorhizobium sp.]TIM84304.1 MAG: hypothetical protein E5Y50_22675 [Mesorhizobium sp.]TIP41198.1 MAG: hypothetical protein E5X62_25855 [Mesorhizobium sp.]TIQ24744.1 MAG: hypothetical protein E5X54_33335 [Mesorhizobium sp.]